MPVSATLLIFQTSDVHMHLLPHDYFHDQPGGVPGLAMAGGVLEQARATATTLLLDTGDLIQGTPMAPLFADAAPDNHPAIHAIRSLNYDAVTLGNHDLNFGLETAQAVYGAMPCPVVQSNVSHPDGQPFFPRTAILERTLEADGAKYPIRIGVFGVLPPQILNWDRDALQDRVCVTDMVRAARDAVADLKSQGADLIIAMAHTAPAQGPQPENAENRAHEIAALPGVDVILAGHSHKRLPSTDYENMTGVDTRNGKLGQTPAMMPGANAQFIARMSLSLSKTDAGWQITKHDASLIPLAGRRACSEMRSRLAPHHTKTRKYLGARIGETSRPVSGKYFAFGYDGAQRLMADAMAWRAAQTTLSDAPLIVTTSPHRHATAPDGLDLQAGAIRRSDLFAIYPYPNALCLLKTNGAVLRAWLEHSARIFAGPDSLERKALLKPDMPSYDFDTLQGLNYRIDPCERPGQRIRDLKYRGRQVQPQDRFTLATSTYRAYGGGDFPRGEVIWTDTLRITEVMEQYLSHYVTVSPSPSLGWTLEPRETCRVIVTGRTSQTISLSSASLAMLAQDHEAPYMSG